MSHRNIRPLVDENNHVVQLSVDIVVADEGGIETVGRFHRIIPEADRKPITEWEQSDVESVCEFLDSEFKGSVIAQSKSKKPTHAEFPEALQDAIARIEALEAL